MGFDPDSAIIDFTTRRMEKANNQKVSGSDISAKLAEAKIYGQKEIDEFKSIIEEAYDKLSDMVLFGDITYQFKDVFINFYLNTIIEPLFKGHNITNISDDQFLLLRKNLFKELILKYCNGKKDGDKNE